MQIDNTKNLPNLLDLRFEQPEIQRRALPLAPIIQLFREKIEQFKKNGHSYTPEDKNTLRTLATRIQILSQEKLDYYHHTRFGYIKKIWSCLQNIWNLRDFNATSSGVSGLKLADDLFSQLYTNIQVTPRPGVDAHRFPQLAPINQNIQVKIATFSDLKQNGQPILTRQNLKEIFKRINFHTLNQPYALGSTKYCKHGIHRTNHNATHAARKVRYFEELINLIKTMGLPNAKAIAEEINENMVLNLLIAIYLLRAGRVDESDYNNNKPYGQRDDYKARSAQIYLAYAEQLEIDYSTKNWMALLIQNSCSSLDLSLQAKYLQNPTLIFCHQLFSLIHELDYVRCYPKIKKKSPTDILSNLLPQNIVNTQLTRLYDFAIQLCRATGMSVEYTKAEANVSLLKRCSNDAAYCRDVVSKLSL